MMALMTIHQCKNLHELPSAVAGFERDVDAYERKTMRPFPPEFKVPAFLRMVPKSDPTHPICVGASPMERRITTR